ncbi:hypothetical protein PR001_g7147 [Phytophthora rubi]|uniref:PiggyBac transposable element-derived protein domain-containing protein n=1 Tax=Phytophthora rubi TaxID=129364 RepID=A0A6A3NIR6_9STRA|nr:hypothetical protein PR001_g7147 [Phytophthora rubi]
MITNKSKLNPLKVYNKDKPNKWGTKFYLTCCYTTAYCTTYLKCCVARNK